MPPKNKTCKYDGCDKWRKKDGYCIRHFNIINEKLDNCILQENINHIEEKIEEEKEKTPDKCNYIECFHTRRYPSKFCESHKDGLSEEDRVYIHPPTIELPNQNYRNEQMNTTIKGDVLEIFVENILKEYTCISDIQRIGQTLSSFDILYRYKDEDFLRGLQVKTLTKSKDRKNKYKIGVCNYTDNMLIVAINQKNNKYFICFKKEFITPTISFHKSNKNYDNNKFDNFEKFKNKLLSCLSNSEIYNRETSLSENCLKEQDSLDRLKLKVRDLHFEYKANDTHASVYDCFINNYSIQHKFASAMKNRSNYVGITLRKHSYFLKGKRHKKPYDVSDNIDFFIFEVNEQLGNFYIVPTSALIKKRYLYDEKTKGKGSIGFYFIPKKGLKHHWILQYYNRFELLARNN